MDTKPRRRTRRAGDVAYQRILVAVDGSPLAEAVLPHALALAHRFGATIELVRAYAPPPSLLAASASSALPGTGPVLDPAPFIAAGRDEAELYLAELEGRLRSQGVAVEHRRLDGSPGEAIAAESRRADVDLIALATHGRGGLGRLVLGSVADHVLHHASCPVLLVRAGTPAPD
jgi:nucleotide-binding universal stress UspA family protein